jgi:hypothetical protein
MGRYYPVNGSTDGDNLSSEEHGVYVQKYAFFEKWLDSVERKTGLMPEKRRQACVKDYGEEVVRYSEPCHGQSGTDEDAAGNRRQSFFGSGQAQGFNRLWLPDGFI